MLQSTESPVIIIAGNQNRAVPLIFIQGVLTMPPRRKEGGMKMVTYSELIQFCILLVGLCYQVFNDRDNKK